MQLKKKKITLGEFIRNYSTFEKMYSRITDWDRSLQIAEQVIPELKKIMDNHDKVLTAYRQQSADADKQGRIDIEKEYQIMCATKEVEFKLATVRKEDLKLAGLNPSELHYIIDFVEKGGGKLKST